MTNFLSRAKIAMSDERIILTLYSRVNIFTTSPSFCEFLLKNFFITCGDYNTAPLKLVKGLKKFFLSFLPCFNIGGRYGIIHGNNV